MKQCNSGKSSISIFQEIFISTDKIFISKGGLSPRQLFYEILRKIPCKHTLNNPNNKYISIKNNSSLKNLIEWIKDTSTVLNISTRQKTELCPTKAASQRKQLSGVKLKKLFESYRRLKTRKYSVSIDRSCSGFSFYMHFKRQFTYTVFYILNRRMCLSKTILHQYFVVFCPFWDSFSSENILNAIR